MRSYVVGVLALLLIAASPAKHPSADPLVANGYLTRAGLVALAQYDIPEAKHDAFSEGKPNKFEAAPFLIADKVSEAGREGAGPATWSYDLGAHTLTLSFDAPSSSAHVGQKLYYRFHEGKRVMGHNALGAHWLVTPQAELTVGLHYVDSPPAQTVVLRDVTPDAGRMLTADLVVLLTGKTARLEDGRISRCDDDRDAATIEDPRDLSSRDCAIAVKISSVRILDRRDQRALLTWSQGEAPPLAARAEVAAPAPTINYLPITDPEWLRRPSADDLADAYPERALRLGRAGTATAKCMARGNGSLTGCEIVSEQPADFGFGAATVKLVPKFRLKPDPSIEGRPVTIPLTFTVPAAAGAPKP